MARTRLEYEDKVQQEEIRRAALEAQLQAVIPDTPSHINQQTPRDRGTQSSNQGSQISRHSHRIHRTPTNSVAAWLAQTAGAFGGPPPSPGVLEGAVGYAANVLASKRDHGDGNHQVHRSRRHQDSSNRQSRHHPPSVTPSQSTVTTITRGLGTIQNVAPDAIYWGSNVVNAGTAEYLEQGQSTVGSNISRGPRSTADLGAVGNIPTLPPHPSWVMGQSIGSLSQGPVSGAAGYYPEEVNQFK